MLTSIFPGTQSSELINVGTSTAKEFLSVECTFTHTAGVVAGATYMDGGLSM